MAIADLPPGAFTAIRGVRFGDCDPAGIVYTPRFVDHLCGAVEDFFIDRGLDYHGLIRNGLGLGYAHVDCDFFKPASMGENLAYTVLVERIGRSSAAFVIHAHRAGEAVLRGRLVMVTTLLEAHRVLALPPEIRAALLTYQELCSCH
jgi:4-hydroxybenzoyl-CoA thioesterase